MGDPIGGGRILGAFPRKPTVLPFACERIHAQINTQRRPSRADSNSRLPSTNPPETRGDFDRSRHGDGLYEYWCRSGRDDAKEWLLAALTTFDDRIEAFRVPGGPSDYCLEHEGQIDEYHSTHVGQLEELYDMTGHDRFHEVAEAFRSDHAPREPNRDSTRFPHDGPRERVPTDRPHRHLPRQRDHPSRLVVDYPWDRTAA